MSQLSFVVQIHGSPGKRPMSNRGKIPALCRSRRGFKLIKANAPLGTCLADDRSIDRQKFALARELGRQAAWEYHHWQMTATTGRSTPKATGS